MGFVGGGFEVGEKRGGKSCAIKSSQHRGSEASIDG
jgi:hypothetical protein